MKWFSVILIASIALLSNACEKHPASQLPAENATAFGPHAAGQHGGAPSAEHAVAKPETPTQTGEVKSGEAPKFFPEKK